MEPLIVRVTENLKVLNKTTDKVLGLLQVNMGDFRGTPDELLLYISVFVKRKFAECDVLVVHLNDGMRIAFVKEHVNKPGVDNVVRIAHERLTFKD